MNDEAPPRRLALRLSDSDRAAVATIATRLNHPHREPASISDVVRAALAHTARTMTASGLPR